MRKIVFMLLFVVASISISADEVYSLSQLKNLNATSDLVIKDGYKVQILVNDGQDLILWDGSAGIFLMDGAYNALNKPAGSMITAGTIRCYSANYMSGAYERGTITDIQTSQPEGLLPPVGKDAWQVDGDNIFDYLKVKGEFGKGQSEWGDEYYCVKDEYNTLAVSDLYGIGVDLDSFVGKTGYFTLLYASPDYMAPLNADFFTADGETPNQEVDKPLFSIAGGKVEKGTEVTLSQPNAALIVYTTDGSTPSFANNVGVIYSGPISIESSMTIKAIAVSDDEKESEVAEATFEVLENGETIDVTVWSEDWSAGEYGDYVMSIENPNATYSMLEDMSIYYTEVRNTNNAGGSAPEMFMPRKAGRIEHFIATIDLNGVYGDMVLSFKSNDDAENPTITIASGTPNATITNVSASGCNISVAEGTEQLQLIIGNNKETKGGLYFDDFLLTGKKTISTEPVHVDAPTFSIAGGEVEEGTTIEIIQPNAALIVYTTDDSTPSYKSGIGNVYDSPIAIVDDVTIRAIAVDDNGNESDVAEANFVVIADDMITLWYEGWDGAAGATTDLWPSEVTNPNAVYSMNKPQPVYIGTKQTNRAGGNAPELALPRQSRNEQWIATINMHGYQGEMKLSYKVNKLEGLSITTSTANVSIGDLSKTKCSLTVAEPVEQLVLVFENTSDEYIYIDDIRLAAPEQEPIDIALNIGESKYATLYYSKYDIALPEDGTLTASTYQVENNSLVPIHTFTDVIPAGYAVVVNGNSNSYTLKGSLINPTAETPTLSYGDLKGTDDTSLTPGNGLFYQFDDREEGCGFFISSTSPAGNAFLNNAHETYLLMPDAVLKSNTPLAYLLDGSVITSVQSSLIEVNKQDDIYSISGVKQSVDKALKRGVYIVGNRKFVVK